MLLNNELFGDFPEEFTMVEDIEKYSNAVLVTLDGTTPEVCFTFEHNVYPVIILIQAIIKRVTKLIPRLSSSFLSAMMIKHR